MESKSHAWKNVHELPNQIKRLREYPQVQGSIFFSSSSFSSNPNGWSDSLRNNYYKLQVATPQMDWLPRNPNQTNSTSFLPTDLRNQANQAGNVKGQK